MIRFRTLGTLDLRSDDDVPIRSVLTQPRRTAILLYLALALPRDLRRKDSLYAMFWPERDAQSTRHALRQTTYFLRRSIGAGVVVSRGEAELGLLPERFWCDASAFTQTIREGRLGDALDLYSGDLAEGFYIADAPGFERWLEDERGRLRAMAAAAGWKLAEEREQAGDAAGARLLGRRALGFTPGDELALRRLLLLLDRLGDRAGALRTYEEFAERLREEYEIEPSAETLGLVGALRARTAPPPLPKTRPSRLSPQQPTPLDRAAGTPVPSPREGWRAPVPSRRAQRSGAGIGALVVLGGILASSVFWLRGEAPPDPEPDLVAVLPFRVSSPDASLDYLRDGMVDLLSAKLTGEVGPRAADSRTVLSAWESRTRGNEDRVGRDAAVGVAREIGAGQLVLGEVVGRPNSVVLQASLVVTGEGRARAWARVEGPVDSLAALVDRLAVQILVLDAAELEHRIADLTSTSLPAIRAYLAGQEAYRQGSYSEARGHYQAALHHDSSFALAALGTLLSAGCLDPGADLRQALEHALRLRHRLSPYDQDILAAFAVGTMGCGGSAGQV